MTQSFDALVERQIQRALAEGKLDGLTGEGEPLPDRSGEAFADLATGVAVRMLAEAGALPEEFKIKKLLDAAKNTYTAAQTDIEKRTAMALIADLQQRYNIAVEARRRFMAP
ncbi:DnaJ family domain-containing protein [uncultured Tateyamaria sp.]|uniref:DnaJ family domain-containing protein n=1 Tax=Tateyamaria sp. 1078 TaxID=3417464 RepID=UPI00262358D0|nr:DnaJ family domain-containing protein [uncultured Tateyamaria sp.]